MEKRTKLLVIALSSYFASFILCLIYFATSQIGWVALASIYLIFGAVVHIAVPRRERPPVNPPRYRYPFTLHFCLWVNMLAMIFQGLRVGLHIAGYDGQLIIPCFLIGMHLFIIVFMGQGWEKNEQERQEAERACGRLFREAERACERLFRQADPSLSINGVEPDSEGTVTIPEPEEPEEPEPKSEPIPEIPEMDVEEALKDL
jgi:hypothetical protein